MFKLIAPKVMLSCEKAWFENSGIPSIEVMERAATCLASSVLQRCSESRRVLIACGPGGNGGDGYACARLLKQHAGMDCTIVRSAPPASPDCIENARQASECGIEILDAELLHLLPSPEIWIDCIYGTGLSRAPEGDSSVIIRRIVRDRAMGSVVFACDIPSGLDGKTGKAFDPCVIADYTVALHFAKYGHFIGDGLDVCGELDIPDIGFPDHVFPNDLPMLVDPEDLHPCFEPRKRNIHKNSCGHLLIIAGSFGMAGAAAMCASAALRSGVGLVSIACPSSIVPILQTLAPCAMCIPLPEENGAICESALDIIQKALPGKTAVAIGCGLTRHVPASILQLVLECGLPAIIDADALNILSENEYLYPLLRAHHILTPHPGEAARILKHPITDSFEDCKEIAAFGATVILKGAARVICSQDKCVVSATGACGMARGGSGDILTGILGALIADKSSRTPLENAFCACELHGVAGTLAQEHFGTHSMNAADITTFLPEAFKRYAD